MSEKNFMAYGDAESVLRGYANRIKQSPTTFVGTQAQWNALSAAQKAEYTLVDITDDEVASQADIDNELADMNNILGAKNLLPNNATTQVLNGITFTVNADGSVTANGTANADTWLWLRSYAQGGLYLPTGRYIINGSVSEASDAYNWSVYVTIAGESTNLATDWGHDANGVEFENTSTSNQLISAIWIRSGAVLNNLLFKPMIRPASIKDDTYVPYSKTNSELTTELSNIASHIGLIIHSTTLDTEAKVIAIYGGNHWIQHSGYVLRGASSGVTANDATKTGGDDNAYLIKHSHTLGYLKSTSGGQTGFIGSSGTWASDVRGSTEGTVNDGINRNIPNYKSVYSWEIIS